MELGREAEIIAEVAFAMALGAIVGAEREMADKPAGLRTHMLVAGAAALLVGLADVVVHRFSGYGELIRSDPIRVMEAVITGISFIGAGTIFRRNVGDEVEGLTTAALLLLSASIGLAAGLDEYAVAGAVALLSLVVLRFMKRFERWLGRR